MNRTSKLLLTLGTLTLGAGMGMPAAEAADYKRCELLHAEHDLQLLKSIATDCSNPCREEALVRLLASGISPAACHEGDEPH